MVKKLRFEENRSTGRHRRREPRLHWVFEPADAVLVALAVAALLWLQWLSPSLPV